MELFAWQTVAQSGDINEERKPALTPSGSTQSPEPCTALSTLKTLEKDSSQVSQLIDFLRTGIHEDIAGLLTPRKVKKYENRDFVEAKRRLEVLLIHGHDPELKRKIAEILEGRGTTRSHKLKPQDPELPFPKTKIIKSVRKGGPRGFVPEKAARHPPWRKLNVGQVTKRLGSKKSLMPFFDRKDEPLIPRKKFETYVDMFGGGLSPLAYMVRTGRVGPETEIVISEMDTDTFEIYEAIRKSARGLIAILKSFKGNPEKYSYPNLMTEYNTDKDLKINRGLIYRAARWIQLGAYCFGSVTRKNRHGRINVTSHREEEQKVFSEEELLAMSIVLQNATLINGDFEKCLDFLPEDEGANGGTFVYADPPYHGQETTKEYGTEDFSETDQKRLAKIFFELQKRGVKMAVSNSDTSFVREIYKEAPFVASIVTADRGSSQHGNKGAKRNEVFATNYRLPWMKRILL